MIKLAGIWERGWNTPIKEIDLWEYPLREYSIDQLYMTPVSGIVSDYVTELNSLHEVILENKDMTLVFVDEKATTFLEDFTHPENALYIFGKAGTSALRLLREGIDKSVCIQTPTNQGMLWPHQAASILLYDRFKKSWL